MEIVTIEARVFERMLRRLEDAAQITDAFCEKHREKKWENGWTTRRPVSCLM